MTGPTGGPVDDPVSEPVNDDVHDRVSGLDAHLRLRRDGFDLDVALRVDDGETVALLGPNGAGKSTTLDLLAGLCPLHDADVRIRLGGRILTDTSSGVFVPPDRRGVGVVFQDHLLFDHLTVLDNVAYPLRRHGASRTDARRAARGELERIGLAAFADRRPSELSGGEAQRVAIVRTLASSPALLLLDEPLAALDVERRSEVRRMLRLHLDGFPGPRVVVTHDPADAFVLADRVVVLEGGRVTQDGSPGEIRRRPLTPYVAALAGTNLFTGSAAAGEVALDGHDGSLTIADAHVTGAVVVSFPPSSVALHPNRPEGSARNTWESSIELVEPLGDTTRITLGAPLPISVDVTAGSVEALRLAPGRAVWAAIKATEITVTPA